MNYTITELSTASPEKVEEWIVHYIPTLPKKLKTTFFGMSRKPEFTKHLSDCWHVISFFRNHNNDMIRGWFTTYIDEFFPLGAPTEEDACYKICQAALVALVTTNEKLT